MTLKKLPPPPRKPVKPSVKAVVESIAASSASVFNSALKSIKNEDMDAAVAAYRASRGEEHTEKRVDAFSHSAIDTAFTCLHKYYLAYVQRLHVPRNINLITGSAIDDTVGWALTPKLSGLPLPSVSAITNRFKFEYYGALLQGVDIGPADPEEADTRASFQSDLPEELLVRYDQAMSGDPAVMKGLEDLRAELFADLWKSFSDRFTGVKLDPEDDAPKDNARILEIALQDLADNHLPAIQPKYLQKTMLMEVPGAPKPFWFIPDIVTVGDLVGVIDVKTSRNKKPDDWASKSSQLEEYQAGLEMIGEQVGELGYLILVKAKKKPWVQVQRTKARTPEQIAQAMKVLTMKARVIASLTEFPPCAQDALANPCSWCDFVNICEYDRAPKKIVPEEAILD